MRDRDAAATIERALFTWPEIPGVLAHLRVRGVVGRVSTVDSPRLNAVGLATLDAREADAAIDAVRRAYGEAGVRGAWLHGPISRPRDLPRRLLAHGMAAQGELAGLVLDDLGRDLPADHGVRVREVPSREAPALADLVARGLGLTVDAARIFIRAAARPDGRTHLFVAALGDDPAPVAFGFLERLAEAPVVLLGGAGTLPEHRGRGAYRALVAARTAVARAEGAEAAIVQAGPETSAPILVRWGFRDVCRIAVYVDADPRRPRTRGLAR